MSQPDSPHATAFLHIADRVAARILGGAETRKAPRIVVQ
jgi:hypothetical protein